MANLFELVGEVSVNGVQTAQAQIQQTGNKAESLRSRMSRAGDALQGFGDRVSSVGDSMTKFSGAVAGATTAVGAAVKQYTDWANATLNASKQLGVGAKELQVWQRTAKRAGVETEAFRDGLKELQLRADEFVQTGKGPGAEALKKQLGLSKEEIADAKGNAFELFQLVRDEISQIEDDAKRQRIMDELFGGQAAERFGRLVQMSREEIEKLQGEVIDAGGILSKEQLESARAFSKEMENFKQEMLAVGKAVAGSLIPQLREALPAIKDSLVPALKSAGQAVISVIKAFSSLPAPVQSAILKMVALSVAFGPVLSIGGRLVGMLGKLFKGITKIPGAAKKAKAGLLAMKAAGGKAATALKKAAQVSFAALVTSVKGATRAIKAMGTAAVVAGGKVKAAALLGGRGIARLGSKAVRGAGRATKGLGRLAGKAGIGGLLRVLGRAIPIVSAFFAGWEIGKLINSILGQFPNAQRAVRDFVGLIAVELPKMVGQAIQKVAQFLGKLPGKVSQLFTQAWQKAKQLTRQAFTRIKQLVKQGMQQAKRFIQQPFKVLQQAWRKGWQMVQQILRQKWNQIKGVFQTVKQSITKLWNKVTGVFKGALNTITGVLNSIKQGFANAFQAIKEQTIGRVKSLVDTVTSKVKAMWQALTGNSIIPRMADEAIAEFGKMADSAEREGERTRKGLEGSVSKAEPGSLSSGGPGAGQLGEGSSGQAGQTVIDMSRATFKDDKDMEDRLKRKGSDMTGAFS